MSLKKTFTTKLTTLILLSLSASAVAKTTLNSELLRQVLKPEAESATTTTSPLNLNDLNSTYASWGIDPTNTLSGINLKPAWENFSKSRDVIVAVIDTGIDPNHPFLKDNLYIPSGQADAKNYGLDFSKNRSDSTQPFDTHGHGTHVAGIIKSVHPKVKILTLKYYNPQASGQDNLNSTIEALRFAVEKNVDIINYSGGGPEPSLEELRILKLAEKKGILVVAAAGNEESNIDQKSNAYYPASYGLSNIITVTAHDQNLQTLASSNYGKKSVDISAPGHRIKSSLPNSRAGFLTGTSQATAFVSGVAALLKSQFNELNTDHLKQLIVKSAKTGPTFTDKTSSGGMLDAQQAQKMANQLNSQLNQNRGIATRVQEVKTIQAAHVR
jgi:subtilisin family serine protease